MRPGNSQSRPQGAPPATEEVFPPQEVLSVLFRFQLENRVQGSPVAT